MSTVDIRSIEWQRKQAWEEVAETTERLRVPGGWLYMRIEVLTRVDTANLAMVFVPDPQV